MAEIKTEEIKKLAELARISLSEEELESFRKDIDSIISYVKQVQKVSGQTGDEDLPGGIFSLIKNKFREDGEPHPSGEFSEEILAEASEREGDYFKVKKIL